MDQQDVEQKIEELVRRDPRYRHDAYPFVANAVTFTVGRLPKHRHVSALELLHGVRDYAQKEFGVLAQQVLDEWGIHEAADVGSIVYSLIGAGALILILFGALVGTYGLFDIIIHGYKRKERKKYAIALICTLLLILGGFLICWNI